jgi:hypothetical protein
MSSKSKSGSRKSAAAVAAASAPMEMTDKLLVVAHPDDEVLWAGANLAAARGWHVVVSSGANNPERRRAFAKTMSWLGVSSWEMYDARANEDSEDVDEALPRYKKYAPFRERLAKLAKKHWSLVLTHDEEGEFGSGDNMAVHALVSEAFAYKHLGDRDWKPTQNLRFFAADAGAPLSAAALTDKCESARFYAPTRNLCRRMHARNWRSLKPVFVKLMRYEKLYVTPDAAPKIPAIYHQIWFGGAAPEYKTHLFNKTREVAKRAGVAYKLWTNDDFKEDCFPLTWAAIQTALEIGSETEQSRWAQVADLARLELMHRFGGAYFDSLIEVSPAMWPALQAANSAPRNATFVGCNEDPCGMKCVGANGEKYLTNSFFAATWRHIVTRRAMRAVLDGEVDLKSKYINRTTGPYFLRKCILFYGAADGVYLFPTEKVFPFLVNGSEYRPAEKNQCLGAEEPGAIQVAEGVWMIKDCLARKYPGALAVYNSGLGGSWSW